MGRRSEQRIAISFPVIVTGFDSQGSPFTITAETQDISCTGACLRIEPHRRGWKKNRNRMPGPEGVVSRSMGRKPRQRESRESGRTMPGAGKIYLGRATERLGAG